MDVIRASTIGVRNVVAMMGTAVTDFQAGLIKKMAKDIILCFDGDKAGAKATISCGDELLKIGVLPKVIALEDNLDPDEYIQKYGADKFLDKVKNPISIMDFKFNYFKLGLNLNSSTDQANYINIMIDEINKIDDNVLKEVTLKKLSDESGIAIEFLKDKIKINKVVPIKKPQIVVKTNKYDIAQRNLIWYMLKSGKVITMYDNKVTYMPNKDYRLLAREISLFYQNFGYINIAEFMDYIMEDESLIETVKKINMARIKEDFELEEIEDYIKVIHDYNVKEETSRLKKQMMIEVSPLEKAKIAQKIIDLKKGSVNNV